MADPAGGTAARRLANAGRRISSVLGDDIDRAFDRRVELFEVVAGDPVLLVIGAAYLVDVVPRQEVGGNGEPEHEADVAVRFISSLVFHSLAIWVA